MRTAVALERLQALHREVDNLRTALSWALDDTENHRVEAGLRLTSALLNFWHTESFQNEGYAWLKMGLSASQGVPVDPRARAKACFSIGHLMVALARTSEAQQWLKESLAIYREIDDRGRVVMAQSLLGEACTRSQSFEKARELGEASVALCQSLHDDWLLAWVLCRFGTSLFYQREHAQARPLIEESLAIFERAGDPLEVGNHFIMLGTISFDRGKLTEARAFYEKGLASARAMQSRWMEAYILLNLGQVAYEQNEVEEMQALSQKSASLLQELGGVFPSRSLLLLGVAEVNLGRHKEAALHFTECLQNSTDTGDIIGSLLGIARVALQTNQALFAGRLLGFCKCLVESGLETFQYNKEYERGLAELKAELDAHAREHAMSEGLAMTLEQAMALALEVQAE